MAVVKRKIFFKVKTKFCFYSQLNYSHPRTAIEAEIHFQALYVRVQRLKTSLTKCQTRSCMEPRPSVDDCKVVRFLKLVSGKTPREQSSSGKKIGAESAVLHFVFFEVIVNKMQQSAKENCLLKRNTVPEVFPLTAILAGSGKTVPFEKRRSRYKEIAENKAEAYRVYVEHLFSACDAVDARIFSKEGANGVYNESEVSLRLFDVDGDGLADRVFNIGGANKLYVQRNKLGKVGLLKKIKLPTGGSYELEYARVGNTRELPQCKYVLSSVTMNSGLQSKSENIQSYRTTYTYKDGYYDRKAKEFYGFKTVRAVTGTGKTSETEYYIDAYYRKGMVKKETVSAGGNIYSIKEYETDEVPHARVKREWNTIREGYREIRKESDYRYDRYGNVTSLEDKGDVTNPNDDIVARIRYWDSGATLKRIRSASKCWTARAADCCGSEKDAMIAKRAR